MKPLKTLTLLLLITCCFWSCESEQGIQLRVRNNYAKAFHEVTIGNMDFGTIESGETTEFQRPTTQYLRLSGSTDDGDELSGMITLPPYQSKKYTLTIKESGEIEPLMD